MSVTYGIYNSLNGDRKYNAIQVSSMFDSLIIDGIFASVGTAFVVKANMGCTVNVGIGRAWFNHTWTLNDAVLPMEASLSEVLFDRIDTIVLEVNASEAVRANSIKFIQGTPSSQPVNPTLISEGSIHQYPLCYIYRAAGSVEITQANITNMVGTSATPFVMGVLKTIDVDDLFSQWEAMFDQWFDNVRAQLGDDAAGNLMNLIDGLQAYDKVQDAEIGKKASKNQGFLPADIKLTAAANLPAGWLLCDGSAVSRASYPALFAAIGATYGVGNGSTTFNLPNLAGRVAVGKSAETEFSTLGKTGGEKTHKLTVAELAAHYHESSYPGYGWGMSLSGGDVSNGNFYPNPRSTTSTGDDQPHNNLQPYITLSYIIYTGQ